MYKRQDYVLTYSEIRAIMKAKSVVLQPAANDDQIASTFGKRFANSGGVTAAVLQSLKESEDEIDAKVCVANGAAECKKALLLSLIHIYPADSLNKRLRQHGIRLLTASILCSGCAHFPLRLTPGCAHFPLQLCSGRAHFPLRLTPDCAHFPLQPGQRLIHGTPVCRKHLRCV